MLNYEKIQILKENIVEYIKNSKNTDENDVFNFARHQSKEMQIEITKGEIKSIVYNILSSLQIKDNDVDCFENISQNELNLFHPFNDYKNPFNDLL